MVISCTCNFKIRNLLRLGIIVVFASIPLSAVSAAPPPGHLAGDPQSCLGCHGERGMKPAAGILKTPHADKSNPKSPFAQQGCQTCHGPSARHMEFGAGGKPKPPPISFKRGEPVAEQNAVCLGCHTDRNRAHWAGSTHEFEGLACASCHKVHAERDPVLQKSSQMEICLDCHRDKRADMHKPSAHPLREGLMSCSDCHNTHGTTGERLLTLGSVNETCFQCHAEKRGPVLWEHAPVAESCSNCHKPHGSMHRPMLAGATPWLCQQCHMASFHPSTAYSGTGVPPAGAAQQLLYRNCLNCHTQVHGSNHPSGVRFTR